MTRMPLDSDCAQCRAGSPQTVQRRNNASQSTHWFDCLSNVRGVDAIVKPATLLPFFVDLNSGSAVRLPTTVMIVSPAIFRTFLSRRES